MFNGFQIRFFLQRDKISNKIKEFYERTAPRWILWFKKCWKHCWKNSCPKKEKNTEVTTIHLCVSFMWNMWIWMFSKATLIFKAKMRKSLLSWKKLQSWTDSNLRATGQQVNNSKIWEFDDVWGNLYLFFGSTSTSNTSLRKKGKWQIKASNNLFLCLHLTPIWKAKKMWISASL